MRVTCVYFHRARGARASAVPVAGRSLPRTDTEPPLSQTNRVQIRMIGA